MDHIITSVKLQALVRDMDMSMRRHKALKTSNIEEYRKKIAQENEFLYEMHPGIYEKHIEGRLDETFFDMLRIKRKIELGEITQDEGDKMFGQKIFDRYVKPTLDKTEPSSTKKPMTYAEYYDQFK